MKNSIMVINGPNLNLLGSRETGIYGMETLSEIKENMMRVAAEQTLEIDFRQSNREGEMVDWIHSATGSFSGLIINAGAYTHTSVALLDALLASQLPAVEVHLSNTQSREAFRHHSYIAKASIGIISGFGGFSYELALYALVQHLNLK